MAACFDYSNNTINSKARGQFPKEICFFFLEVASVGELRLRK